MSRAVTLEVYFDLICPWCLIGRRHLKRALRLFAQEQADARVHVDWQPVQLLPQIPQHGVPYREFYAHRLGGEAAVRARQAEVQAAAAQAGLRLAFERIGVMPNTARAHRWLRFAAGTGGVAAYDSLLEALFRAYFRHGEDIGDPAVLACLAARAGLDTAREAAWEPPDAPPRAHLPDGVPCFVFNGRAMLSGALPPALLLAALRDMLAPHTPVSGGIAR